MRRPNVYAGQTLPIEGSPLEIVVEDWAENVLGESWMRQLSAPAFLHYATRLRAHNLPNDGDVLYGKVEGLGVMVHATELTLPIQNI